MVSLPSVDMAYFQSCGKVLRFIIDFKGIFFHQTAFLLSHGQTDCDLLFTDWQS